MGVTIFRPGQRMMIPGNGVQVWSPRAASASGGWWDNNGAISGCVAAYQPKGAASLASSYTNLTGNVTYNAAPGVAPTFNSSAGWTFNGSSQYLTTGIVVSRIYTVIVRFSASVGGYLFGAWKQSGTILYGIQPVSGGNRTYWNGTSAINLSGGQSSGVIAIVGASGYINGVLDATLPANADTGLALHIGSLNRDGTASNFIGATIQALAIYSITLSAGQVATLTTLMNAL